MQAFETIIIFKGDMTEEEVEAKEKEYLHYIVHSDNPEEDCIPTTVHKIEGVGKKKLAYDIRNNTHGWYTIYTYRSERERITQLERIMRKDNDVIKFITMKIEDNGQIPDHIIEEEKIHKIAVKPPIDLLDIIYGLN